MNSLTYNITQKVANIDKKIIDKIDDIEEWTGGISYFGDFLDKCDNNYSNIESIFHIDKDSLIHILACVKTSYLIKFLRILAEHDYNEFKVLISYINNTCQNSQLSQQVSDRIILLYRVTVFPELFSNDNFMIICNTVNKNN